MLKFILIKGTFLILVITLPLKSQSLHTVQILDATFSPSTLTINAGDTVLWVMSSSVAHTVTSGENCTSNGSFNSGNLSGSQTFEVVFTQEGSYPYFCLPHCHGGMVGEVIVEATQTQVTDLIFYTENFRIINPGPNPIQKNGLIELEFNTPAFLSISLFDVTGRKVFDITENHFPTGIHHIKFDVSHLPTGLYLESYFMEGFPVRTRKIVKE